MTIQTGMVTGFRVRDVKGAKRSAERQTERKRSPEQPGPQGNAQISLVAVLPVAKTERRKA